MAKKEKNPIERKIEVKGDISGIGNVVGDESKSNVKLTNTPASSQAAKRSDPSTVLLLRVLAFIIGVVGTLGAIALFIRLLAGFDSQFVFLTLLSGLVGVLGVMGALRPGVIEKLLELLVNKQP